MPGTDRQVVRSYQRIFRPDRRIYQIEGHQLPVPGGVPLAWLAHTVATILTVVVLSAGTLGVSILAGLIAAAVGWILAGRDAALLLGVAGVGGSHLFGLALAVVDWPLRLLVLPALVATVATQVTPDGRAAHRYAASWLALHLRPVRRSLGRPLPAAGARRSLRGQGRIVSRRPGSRRIAGLLRRWSSLRPQRGGHPRRREGLS